MCQRLPICLRVFLPLEPISLVCRILSGVAPLGLMLPLVATGAGLSTSVPAYRGAPFTFENTGNLNIAR
jgi:hypothetical protein